VSDVKAYSKVVAGAVDAIDAFLQSEAGLTNPHVFDDLLRELRAVLADIADRKIDHALKRWRRDVRPQFNRLVWSHRGFHGKALANQLMTELDNAYALQGRSY
jgi:hypothetical protein